MAGLKTEIGGTPIFIDFHDGEGSAVVNGKLYKWEFHEYCGPIFLKKDGEPLKRQPGERNPVWEYFNLWLLEYKKNRKKTPCSEIVRC